MLGCEAWVAHVRGCRVCPCACLLAEQGFVPGGNIQQLAPEVVNSFRAARYRKEGVLSYAGQPAWELGTALFRLVVGQDPWPDYPDAYEHLGAVMTNSETLRAWLPVEYPPELSELIVTLLNFDPVKRPSVQQALDMLLDLRNRTWGMGGEPRWPTDASVSGRWVNMWAFSGSCGQVPVPPECAVGVLRDYAASRVCIAE
jgi:hypothetical protein